MLGGTLPDGWTVHGHFRPWLILPVSCGISEDLLSSLVASADVCIPAGTLRNPMSPGSSSEDLLGH